MNKEEGKVFVKRIKRPKLEMFLIGGNKLKGKWQVI